MSKLRQKQAKTQKKIQSEVQICYEKTATSKENGVITVENTDNCKENEPEPAIVTENKEIPVEAINEALDINEEYTVADDSEAVLPEEIRIEEEPAAEEIAEEQVEYDYLYDENKKLIYSWCVNGKDIKEGKEFTTSITFATVSSSLYAGIMIKTSDISGLSFPIVFIHGTSHNHKTR